MLLTDFQRLGSSDLVSLENFFLAIGSLIAAQLQAEVYPQEMWQPALMPNFNFDRYIREHVLKKTDKPVFWAMDETDKILACPFRDDVFALFRSWHSDRVLQPHEPCNRLTLALAYSTEPYLFIKDLNQSPFNIGTKIFLEDFTLDNIRDLNSRYGSPLYQGELEDFLDFTGGQPYLVRCSLNEMVIQGLNFSQFIKYIQNNENALTDHLKRLLLIFSENQQLRETVKSFIKTNFIESYDDFFRLRSAGILVGSQERPRFRCRLYKEYLGNL